MSSLSSPFRPDPEFYRKRAKALLRDARAGDPAAAAILRQFVPRLRPQAADLAAARLHDSQLAVARENGFPSWPAPASACW